MPYDKSPYLEIEKSLDLSFVGKKEVNNKSGRIKKRGRIPPERKIIEITSDNLKNEFIFIFSSNEIQCCLIIEKPTPLKKQKKIFK